MSISSNPLDVHSGNFSASFGGKGALTQAFGLTKGKNYTLEFSIMNRNSGSATNEFVATLNKAEVLHLTNVATAGVFKDYSFNFTAASTSMALQFSATNSSSYWIIDDVHLNPATSVPEPSSFALLAAAAMGVAGRMLQQRRARVQ